MKKKTIVITIIIVVLIIALCRATLAESISELQVKRSELQYQIENANDQIEGIEIELTELLEQVNDLNEKIYSYETQLDELETQLNTLQIEITAVNNKLKNLEIDYSNQKRVLEQRLVILYEAGEIRYLDLLLDSNSLADFISNCYLISEIAKYDSDLLDNIKREEQLIKQIKQALNEKKEIIKTATQSKEKTAIILENAKVVKNSYMNQLSEQELVIQTRIDEYQNELNKINAEIIFLATGSIGEEYAGGVLAWPAPGYRTITSVFGTRIHPIYKVKRFHSGLDIAVPTGGYIIAANDGVVVKASYITGYGNMVMINHGGGISTVYGHGSEIICEAGQEVKVGDIIMKAGSTGISTGPHLHFEVRINGTYVDPLPYITSDQINNDEGGETNE